MAKKTTSKKKTTAKKAESSVGRPSTYDQGKPAAQGKIDAAAKRINKADKKPSVTAVAREYMSAGFDNASVLKLLKAVKIKHNKDESGMASLRRSLARSGDIEIGGAAKPAKKKAKVAPKKEAKKKTSSKKAPVKSKKKIVSKKKAAKKADPKPAKDEDEDFMD